LHWKVEPPSVEENVKAAFAELDGFDGFESMVVFGATVSTDHVYWAGVASVFPAWSVARTLKVWLPSERPE
jgi:hypothetical protein